MSHSTSLSRALALVLTTLAVVATLLVSTPAATAADRTTRDGRQAVALSSEQVEKQRERRAERRERRAERRKAAQRRLNRRLGSARRTAMAQRGDVYSYGSSGPNAFDCSGLVYYSYRRAGFRVPRTSRAQAGHTRRVAKKNMRPGDLMFFANGGGVYHVGIFLRWERGRAMMVHAPSTGSRVHVAAPWTSRWFGGTLRR